MEFSRIVEASRSFRRFDRSKPIPRALMKELVDLARICPSTANRQALKFKIVDDPEGCAGIYPSLGWAGYLTDWDGPAEEERPTGYIVILNDTEIRKEAGVDPGIAAQTILLGAAEKGYGGCMIGSLKREALKELFGLPDTLEIALVLALGTPAEEVLLEETTDRESIRYYRDAEDRHHVPKRPLAEVLLP